MAAAYYPRGPRPGLSAVGVAKAWRGVWFSRAMVGVVLRCVGAAAHHLEHRTAAGTEEADQEGGSQQQEDDVEHGGVVPLDARFGDLGRALGRDEPKPTEEELDDVAGEHHRDVEDAEQ